MRLAILGGGGFRVPQVYAALLADRHPARVTELVLHDVDPARLTAITHTLAQLAAERLAVGDLPVTVTATTDLNAALDGVEVVFSAIRVGGLAGRVADERVALDLGVLGQETTGPGGLAYGLRTVPVALDIATRVAARSPGAWFINFTNPAGMITQAMRGVLGEKVVGICDSPVGLGRRAARALGLDPTTAIVEYAGLNHLGWVRGVRACDDGPNLLPELIADPEALAGIEEGRLFGPEWLQTIDALPNEYLYYYYFAREALAGIRGSALTRGEFLLDRQEAFYAAVAAEPGRALALWRAARREREETYMAAERGPDIARDAPEAVGGYEEVALAIVRAISRGEPARLILNVAGGSPVAGLPAQAVVERACLVDARGVHPLPAPTLDPAMRALVQQVKAAEQLTIAAAVEGSPRLAVAAFAAHPLVDSVSVARQLLAGYRARIPGVDAVFAGEAPST